MADIAIHGATKVYDGGALPAVDAVDLGIADGELLVLVGPSGCGKSTLLRMIAGLEEVTDGSISIGGRDVTHLAPKDRDVAMVFQSYALYPHMTVRRNIGYPLKLAKTPKDEIDRRVEETAELLQLTDELERRPAQLSGGQRQRVAMGRAIVRHPRAFLMDEPLSNLDAKLRVEMRAEIARLQRELAVTTVYVTHDQVEAMTMGTRVAVLQKGRLQQVATPQRLYDEPDNLFVATFIGSPAMNLFPGHVEAAPGADATGTGLTLRSGQHRLALDKGTLARHPALPGMVGQPVVVGIRPECLADVALEPGVPADRVIEATVDLVESLGAELIVHVTVSDPAAPGPEPASDAWRQVMARRGRAVARLGTRSRLSAGDVVKLAVDTSRLHLFDAETGASLRSAGAA
ncbi:MAG TPA: sn-glycerol-3-phosphate ABC transporter ATP-binding protein UgpC [Acidimicrobiales bacterium]|nr:sn-glycerol-3-phosphate ABC transporter ATP-binding protein UgpC [Acidimicrobiales bacterium]